MPNGFRDKSVASENLQQGGNQIGCRGALDDVAVHSNRLGFCYGHRFFVHAEEENTGARFQFLELPCCLETIQKRHGDICHQEVRMKVTGGCQKRFAIPDRPYHVKLRLEQLADQVQKLLIVIRQQYRRSFYHALPFFEQGKIADRALITRCLTRTPIPTIQALYVRIGGQTIEKLLGELLVLTT